MELSIRNGVVVVFDWNGKRFPTRNARLDALLLEHIPEPFCVIASVGQHPLRFGQIIKQGRRAGLIDDLARRGEEIQRAAIGISAAVQLGVHAALGPSDRASEIPFLPQGWTPCRKL